MSCLGPFMYTRSTAVQTPPWAFWGRTFGVVQPKLETAYITLVHFTLEYAASIWDHHLAKDWFVGEVKWQSVRFVKGDYRTTSSVSQMLHDLGCCDLKNRWWDLRLALLYKIVTGHVAINPDQIGLVAADNRTRANHRYKFRAIGHLWLGCATHLLSEVSDWNHLPAVVVEQQNPAAFKAQLARSAPVACHNLLPPLAWYSTRRSADYCARQDKTRQDKM